MADVTVDQLLGEMPRIAKVVNEFKSEKVQQQAFAALLDALQGAARTKTGIASAEVKKRTRRDASGNRRTKGTTTTGRKSKPTLSIVKDLNLRPKGKKSFRDYGAEKKPKSLHEQCTVSVYYLTHICKVGSVDPRHVYTCFKDAKWRLPTDLVNKLQWTASQKGWLDTTDSNNIGLTPAGENLVEHDLPRKTEPKSKK